MSTAPLHTAENPAGDGPVLAVRDLRYTYPARGRSGHPVSALGGITFSVPGGNFFCVLGPNGSGKSTLFRILTTALRPDSGTVMLLGRPAHENLHEVRSRIGVVFQHPALDKKLTVRENLRTHGRLYGMTDEQIVPRTEHLLTGLGVRDRADDRVEVLSGGLQRRVELAKSLVHSPEVLFLDEPTTGLDPVARRGFISLLKDFQSETGATLVYTTHLLDEAEGADGLLILEEGEIVAEGCPADLLAGFGNDLIALRSQDPEDLASRLRERYALQVSLVDDSVRVESHDASSLVPELLRLFGDRVSSVTISRPSIEDVYIRKTGHRFRNQDA